MSVRYTFNNRSVGIYPLLLKSDTIQKENAGNQMLVSTKATRPVRARIYGETAGSTFTTQWVDVTVGGSIMWTKDGAQLDNVSTVSIQNKEKFVESTYSGQWYF